MIKLTPHPEKPNLFIVADEFTCCGITVTAGALTNGATIPYLLRWIFPRWHPHYTAASIIHDFLVGEHGQPVKMRWSEAAVLFSDIMRLQGAQKWKISLFKFAILKYRKIKRWAK